jgi:hypothetical protein
MLYVLGYGFLVFRFYVLSFCFVLDASIGVPNAVEIGRNSVKFKRKMGTEIIFYLCERYGIDNSRSLAAQTVMKILKERSRNRTR